MVDCRNPCASREPACMAIEMQVQYYAELCPCCAVPRRAVVPCRAVLCCPLGLTCQRRISCTALLLLCRVLLLLARVCGSTCMRVLSHFQGLDDIADFLTAAAAAADGRHAPVAGWLWWALNPNSNDTGGLVRGLATSISHARMLWQYLVIVAAV